MDYRRLMSLGIESENAIATTTAYAEVYQRLQSGISREECLRWLETEMKQQLARASATTDALNELNSAKADLSSALRDASSSC